MVSRGEGARRGAERDDASSFSFSSWNGVLAGDSVSGDKTTVGESCSMSLCDGSMALFGSSSSSSSAVRLPKVGARGVLSSKISSSGLSLIGGNLERPSKRSGKQGRRQRALSQNVTDQRVSCETQLAWRLYPPEHGTPYPAE